MAFLSKLLLWPLARLYGALMWLRNLLYDIGWLKSWHPPVPTLCVGNLSAGGTGKTPMVELIVEYFRHSKKVAVLSRGYGRKTKGYLLAHRGSQASEIGDEPLQIYQRFDGQVSVIVCEDRVEGIKRMIVEIPGLDLIVMDDGYQHRAVTPWASVLLTAYRAPFTIDYPLPLGRLREARTEARRASCVVITKVPKNTPRENSEALTSTIKSYLEEGTEVYHGTVRYGVPRKVMGRQDHLPTGLRLVSGIANPSDFEQFAEANFDVIEAVSLYDHIVYDERLARKFFSDLPVLVTQKDAVKLSDPVLSPFLKHSEIWYLPIEADLGPQQSFFFDDLRRLIG